MLYTHKQIIRKLELFSLSEVEKITIEDAPNAL